jgi:predicted ABC-class ATPase
MAAESERNTFADNSAREGAPSQVTEEVMRQQIHRHRRRRSRSARERSKRKKRMRLILIVAGQALFILLLVYAWFEVSSRGQ